MDKMTTSRFSTGLGLGAMLLLAFAFLTTQQASAQTTGSGDYSGPEYRIGPEDVLFISVWKEEDLTREVLVRPDGGISFPLAGALPAAGLTTPELEAELSSRIQKYVPEAVVSVTVTTVSGYKIFVLGEVNDPGQYVVGRYVDVLQALTIAGGLTAYANDDDIKIVRREGAKETVIPFDYSKAKRGKGLSENVMLQSGDVIMVP